MISPRPTIEILGYTRRTECACPLVSATVPAGFPSPADDYVDQRLDLNDHLIAHPEATFFVRVHGDSMTGAGIQSGDLLVVDRSLQPADGHVVIAIVDGELTVKRVRQRDGQLWLLPENPDFAPTRILPETDFEVWGVATSVIHKL